MEIGVYPQRLIVRMGRQVPKRTSTEQTVQVTMGVKVGLYLRDTGSRSEACVLEFWPCH